MVSLLKHECAALRFVAQVSYARQRRCASLPRRMSSPASSCSSVECAPAAARTSLEVGATISVLIRSRSCFRPLSCLIICFGIVSRVVLGWNGSCVSRVRGSVRLFFFFCSGYALVIVYAVYSTRVLVRYMGNGQLFVFGSFFFWGTIAIPNRFDARLPDEGIMTGRGLCPAIKNKSPANAARRETVMDRLVYF